jgi:hypothetical protein
MNNFNSFADFKPFQNEGLTRVIDKITITKGNQFNFPTAMYQRNHLKNYKAVRLYYNKKASQVGIEFLKDQEEGSFKMILSEGGRYGAFIVAKSFFFLNDLKAEDYAGRYSYDSVKFTDMGADRPGSLYVISLKDEGEASD